MRAIVALLTIGVFASACSSTPSDSIGSTEEGWTTGTPACGTTIGSWNGINAYSNGKCFGNVNCINCDGSGFSVHTSSNGQTAYGGAWQCVELITRAFDTKYKIWLSNNAGTPLCNSANGTSGLTVYGPGYHNTSPPKPVAGDAVVWNYNGGVGHVALVTGGTSTTVTYVQQNWGSPTGYAATGSTSWNGSNFGAPSDSLGGFTAACWIHVNANAVGTCPLGNGLYCGGNGGVSGDPTTLYTCTNGTLTVDQVCSLGCDHMPNYVDDKCYPCPKGDGNYCGGTLNGTTAGTLYSCKAGDVNPVETCANGCTHVAPQSDVCVPPPPIDERSRATAVPPPPSQPDAGSTDPNPVAPSDGGCNAAPSGGSWPSGAVLALILWASRRRKRMT